MWQCQKCGTNIDEQFDSCWACGTSKDGVEDSDFKHADDYDPPPVESVELPPGMILSTTHSLQTHSITEYLGVVAGQAVMGAWFVSDIIAGITDVLGGRSGVYESRFQRARHVAVAEMAHSAAKLGANAVVGIDIDYETIRGSMLMVSCSGTAVKAESTS